MTTRKEIKEAKKADLKRALELDPAATSEWQIKHLAILIPTCASSSPAFLMMYSAQKLNKQGDNIQP